MFAAVVVEKNPPWVFGPFFSMDALKAFVEDDENGLSGTACGDRKWKDMDGAPILAIAMNGGGLGSTQPRTKISISSIFRDDKRIHELVLEGLPTDPGFEKAFRKELDHVLFQAACVENEYFMKSHLRVDDVVVDVVDSQAQMSLERIVDDVFRKVLRDAEGRHLSWAKARVAELRSMDVELRRKQFEELKKEFGQ